MLSKMSSLFLLFILLLTICMVNFLFLRNSVFNVSAVETTGNIEVYWDEGCTQRAYSIYWGVLSPGEVKEVVVYVRNEGNESFLLGLRSVNWNPENASNYLNFSWSCEDNIIAIGEVVKVTQCLLVSPFIRASSDFGFDIIFERSYDDIAITKIAPQKSVIGAGYSMPINLTFANQGEHTETFNVTVYANTSFIASQTVILSSRNSTTVIFVWNTSDFAKGNYTIRAYATPVPDETDTADNSVTDGTITVVHPGDLNNDCVVDIADVVLVTAVYRSRIGEPKYRPNPDIIYDGVIDIADVVSVTAHYRETC